MLNKSRVVAGALMVATSALVSAPALAQKAKDTLRIGVYQPIATIDAIFDPQPQTNLMDRVVFDGLVTYDTEKREVAPGLAESWKNIDDRTVEFKLRQGVKYHDGSEFDADDVVYMVNFVIDPETKFRFKETRFGQIESVEKVDKFTVRLKTKTPYAPFLNRLTTILPIYPSDVHSKLADKSTFGRNPIGTGPYKALKVDPGKSVTLVKNPDFKHASAGQPEAKIGRIEITVVPDAQTQVARMMVGDQDLMYDVPTDVADLMAPNPAIQITSVPSISFTYLMLDAAGRSGVEHFKDVRVREAMMRAVDRKALTNALQPKEIAALPLQKSMCHEWHVGCAASTSPPDYDLAKAKQLMAEAGKEKGFDLTITTWGAARPVAEAVAGQLRRIGVNAKIENLTVGGFVTKRAAGQLPAYIVLWDNGGANPDVESTSGFFYEPGSRNYNNDAELADLDEKAKSEMDPKKREAIYQRIFDKVNEQRYSMPITPLGSVLAHSKEVRIPKAGTKKPEGFMFNLLAWN